MVLGQSTAFAGKLEQTKTAISAKVERRTPDQDSIRQAALAKSRRVSSVARRCAGRI